MGREIKRVPVDWDWPVNKVWDGYLQPKELYPPVCPTCNGSGETAGGHWLHTVCYLLSMLCEEAKNPKTRHGETKERRHMHPWLLEMAPAPDREVGPPTPDMAELVETLAGQPHRFCSSYSWRIKKALIKAAGFDEDKWGHCPTCEGVGDVGTPEQRAASEAWERTEPPAGDGYQLWETVSEGSPISPAFGTPEELAKWMASPAYKWGATREPVPYERALAFITGPGWAPSFVAVDGVLQPEFSS